MSRIVVPGSNLTSDVPIVPPGLLKTLRISAAVRPARASKFSEYRAAVAFSALANPSSGIINQKLN